jgi:hypothetical protein
MVLPRFGGEQMCLPTDAENVTRLREDAGAENLFCRENSCDVGRNIFGQGMRRQTLMVPLL